MLTRPSGPTYYARLQFADAASCVGWLESTPLDRPAQAHEMIAEVKGAKLLRGFRGRAAADLDTLAETLVRVSHLAVHLEGTLAELDINPLMVLPTGVKAADALVVLRSPQSG